MADEKPVKEEKKKAAPAPSGGKKKGRETVSSKKWEMYSTEGGKLVRKGKPCPKCGSGVFMGEHKNRTSCGKCHYTEFKKSEVKK